MTYTIKPFRKEYIEEAAALFLSIYSREREISIHLPESRSREKLIRKSLTEKAGNPSAVILENGKLISFMLSSSYFNYKGQKTAVISEYAHGSRSNDKKELYRLMYKEVASQWIKNKVHLHIIGHMANDHQLKEILFQLGFGAILAERLRDLSPLGNTGNCKIVKITDPEELLGIQLEHNSFYPDSPTFISKSMDRDIIYKNLKELFDSGYQCFAYCEGFSVSGYMIVGESAIDEEGYLLRHSNSAALHSAFIQPHLRGQGIGAALLNKSIDWALKEGFERIMVEHETANYFGEAFWSRYFDPYLFISLRYIDSGI